MPRLRLHMGSRGTSWPSSTVVPMCGRRCPVPVAVSVAVSAAATLWEWLRVVIELGGRSRSRSRHRLACSWVRAPSAASIGSMFIVTRLLHGYTGVSLSATEVCSIFRSGVNCDRHGVNRCLAPRGGQQCAHPRSGARQKNERDVTLTRQLYYYKSIVHLRVAPLWGTGGSPRPCTAVRGVALAIALAFTYFIGSDLVNT